MAADKFHSLYLDFQLEDELLEKGQRDVMLGVHYAKRHGMRRAKARVATLAREPEESKQNNNNAI
jgi:hypothetical protein